MGPVVDMGPGTVLIALFSWVVVTFITNRYGSEMMTGFTEEEKAAKLEKKYKK